MREERDVRRARAPRTVVTSRGRSLTLNTEELKTIHELSAHALDQVSGGIKVNGIPLGLPPAAGPAPMQELPPEPPIFQHIHLRG